MPSRLRADALVPAALFGAAAAACSVLLVVLLFGTAPVRPLSLLVPSSVVASAVTGGTAWWLLVTRPDRRSRRRGAVVGVVTTLLAHPLTWLLALLVHGVVTPEATVGGQPLTLVSGLRLGLFYAAVSLVVTGFPTAVVAAGVGTFLVRLRSAPSRSRR